MKPSKNTILLIVLIVLLLFIPLAVIKIMGFDKYDANEFLILSVALFADVAVYIAYKLILPRLSS